jgi:transcriptional regulator with XRE-family HTH domain
MPRKATSIELGTRIASARKAAGIKTQSELAGRLEVTRGAVSQWETGETEPSASSLRRIAMVTEQDFDWLATGRTRKNIPTTRVVSTTRVVGTIEGEAWRDGFGIRQEIESQLASESKWAPYVPHPNLSGVRQFAFEVRGCSANLTARAGEYALCIDYQEARPGGLHEGDLIVLEKRRSGEYKVMIARLHFINEAWELHYESDHPRWMQRKPIRLSEDRKRDINIHICKRSRSLPSSSASIVKDAISPFCPAELNEQPCKYNQRSSAGRGAKRSTAFVEETTFKPPMAMEYSMGIEVRYYLFADDGLKRLSRRLYERMVSGTDTMPQYAGTTQKIACIVLDTDNGKPSRISGTRGSYLQFDDDGKIRMGLARALFENWENLDDAQRAQRITPHYTALDPRSKLNRQRLEGEDRWELSEEDLAAVKADIWKKGGAGSQKVEQAKGVAAKRPPLSHEAQRALSDIALKLALIGVTLTELPEAALKGIAFEAREEKVGPLEDPLWTGVSQAAEKRREILARHRTGRGTWFAVIEAARRDVLGKEETLSLLACQKCSSKAEAEKAVRRLLAENAKSFDDLTSIEARVACDLEWSDQTDI